MRYQKTILENGVRVIFVPMPGNPTVTCGIGVNFGSSHETEKNNGIAHFLEHMCFKGTKNRTRQQIVKEFEDLAVSNNAYTNSDHTFYHFKVAKKGFEKAFDVLADMYANSVIPEDELEKERGVILEEINMYEDNPRRKVYEAFGEAMFEGHSLAMSTIGTKSNIKSFQQKDFLEILENEYVGSATTVVVAGDLKNKDVTKLINEKLGHLKKSKLHKPEKFKSKQKTANLKVVNKKTDQSHLILGFRTFNAKDKDFETLDILKRIIGSGCGSRLFEKIREELGLCYYVGASNGATYDTGYQAIFAGVGNDMVEKAVEEIVKILKDVKENGVTEAELKRAKNLSINSMMMNLETSEQLAEFFGDQELDLEDIKKPQEVIQKIKKITTKDVKKLANRIYKDKSMTLAVIGPHKKSQKLQKLLKI